MKTKPSNIVLGGWIAILFWCLVASIIGTGTAFAVPIFPTQDGIVRDGILGPFPSDPAAPKDGTPDYVIDNTILQVHNTDNNTVFGIPYEDRSILEFDVTTISPASSGVELTLNIHPSTRGPFPLNIDVYTYIGNGSVELGDWSLGSLFSSFVYSGEATIVLDVTSFVLDQVVSGGHTYAGFNLRSGDPAWTGNEPFPSLNLHSLENGPSATLQAVPEPTSLALMSLGLAGIGYRRKKTK